VLGRAAKSKRMGGACPACKGRGRIESPACTDTPDSGKSKTQSQSMFDRFRKGAKPEATSAKAEHASTEPVETSQTSPEVHIGGEVRTEEVKREDVRIETPCTEEVQAQEVEEAKAAKMEESRTGLGRTVGMEADKESEASTAAPEETQAPPNQDEQKLDEKIEQQVEQVEVLKNDTASSDHAACRPLTDRPRQVSIESTEKFIQCSHCCITAL